MGCFALGLLLLCGVEWGLVGLNGNLPAGIIFAQHGDDLANISQSREWRRDGIGAHQFDDLQTGRPKVIGHPSVSNEC